MGSWECYCAICGGPTSGVQISSKPRTARFLRRQEQRQQRQAGNPEYQEQTSDDSQGYKSDSDGGGSDGEESDVESLATSEEECSYDPDIVSEEDTDWTGTLHVLGFNNQAPGINKAFVSGPGQYESDMYGSAIVEAGDDPNFPTPDQDRLGCYWDEITDSQAVFPFHWCCYELLSRVLTGTPDVKRIKTDRLYVAMNRVTSEYASRLKLDYGDPNPPMEQFWLSSVGEEFFVISPAPTTQLGLTVRSDLERPGFKLPDSDPDLSSRIVSDPFKTLPYELVNKIFNLLDNTTLFDLAKVSWSIHSRLKSDTVFWRQRIKKDMPWFVELLDLMDDHDFLKGKDLKRLVMWSDRVSTPRRGMSGPYMAIANRRRIWGVCEQLAALYASS